MRAYVHIFLSVFTYLSAFLVTCAGFLYGPELLILPLYVSTLFAFAAPVRLWINRRKMP